MDGGNIPYALAHTEVLYVPDRRIDTFGDTRFNFRLITEPMDEVGSARVRSGWVEARRPRILRPADMNSLEMEGFTPVAAEFFHWLRAHGGDARFLFRYGFCFSRSEVLVENVHEDARCVAERAVEEALESGDGFRAVIRGVDDAWEASLLRFMVEMIQHSHEINTFDFRRRGLI